MRLFKVTKEIKNKILGYARVGEILYLKGEWLYNAYNMRVCDMGSEIQKECTFEISS